MPVDEKPEKHITIERLSGLQIVQMMCQVVSMGKTHAMEVVHRLFLLMLVSISFDNMTTEVRDSIVQWLTERWEKCHEVQTNPEYVVWIRKCLDTMKSHKVEDNGN